MFSTLEWLEKIGVGKRLKGKFLVNADKLEFGVAKADNGAEGLAISLENTLIHMEFLFIETDCRILIELRKTIDEILEKEKGREVI